MPPCLRGESGFPDEAGLLKVGLTGGIASGKSVVGEMFVAFGAHLTQADAISHQLMQPGEGVYEEVVQHFGGGILNPDGTVNRARLAEAAFGSPGENKPSRIQELNQPWQSPADLRGQFPPSIPPAFELQRDGQFDSALEYGKACFPPANRTPLRPGGRD